MSTPPARPPTAASPSTSTDGDPLRVALAAGGTGGHLMPALAAAEAIAARTACEFLLVGSPRAGERQLRSTVPYPTVEVRARPLAGRGLLGRARSLATLPASITSAATHLRRFRTDLVIATGGYVCGPTGIAAWLLGTPLLVLEQNADPGLTTRLLRPFATAIGVSFAVTAERLGAKATVTGNPVRADLPAAPHRDGLPRRRTGREGAHLLILGGSQGAHGLNVMVELAIPLLADADVALTVTHQTGAGDVEVLDDAWRSRGIPATVTPFIHQMGEAYARADLACARAGATTVAELAYCGIPAVLVPYPHAAGRHQHANARLLAEHGAAIVVEETGNGRPLAEAILEIAGDRDRLTEMAAAAAHCGRDDAAGAVAELALELVDSGRLPRNASPTTRERSSVDIDAGHDARAGKIESA